MDLKVKKEQYVAPLLEEVTYVVEEGFAESWFEPFDPDPRLFGAPHPPGSEDPDGDGYDYFMGGPLNEETW